MTAQGDLRGADVGGKPSAPNVPVAQPMIVAQPAPCGGQQDGRIHPAGAQVIVVQAQPPQEDPFTCAFMCFILGFFFYFPWFGCYVADGGLCSEKKNAKCWNILSCVFLSIPLVYLAFFLIVAVLFVGSYGVAVQTDCDFKASCFCKARYCNSCNDCLGNGYAHCRDLSLGRDEWYCHSDVRTGTSFDHHESQCFDKKEVCYGGEIGSFLTEMMGDRCVSIDDRNSSSTSSEYQMCPEIDRMHGLNNESDW
jgi:hypothetical protein